jgi:hypothetical protein
MKSILSVFIALLFAGCNQFDENTAAQFAATLANKECARLYKQEPFSPDNYKAVFQNNYWTWGKLDPTGINGFSAEVTFDKSGKKPRVSVQSSTDNTTPEPLGGNEMQQEIKALEKK